MTKRREFWIQKAVKRPGALRETLQRRGLVKPGQKIPTDVLNRAAKGAFGPQTARRARFAKLLRRFNNK